MVTGEDGEAGLAGNAGRTGGKQGLAGKAGDEMRNPEGRTQMHASLESS